MKPPVPNKENVVAQVAAREPTIAGNRFSFKFFIIAFVFTGAVLAWLTWSTYDLYTRDTIISEQAWRAGELRNKIIHLDEVLTMSARMAAATGDPQWEERYRTFEPQLDEAIKEIMKLTPSQMLAETDAANIKLVGMENRAFTLVRDGHAEKAHTILSSEEYETQKRIYADGISKFFAQLESLLNTAHRSQRKKAVFSAGAGIVVLAILLFSGLAIMRWLYKSHAVLLTNITKRKQAEDVLRKAHHELEVRVKERTADLTTANSTLVKQIAERGQVEASLRESEERYRELFENAQDAIYVHDVNGKYLSVNRAAEKLGGYSRDEIIGRNFAEFMAPEYGERIRTNIGKNLEGKGLTTYEIEVLAKDGRSVPVEVSTRMIHEKGIVIGVQSVARDITERKLAEEALRQSESQFRRVLESNVLGIYSSDFSGEITEANDAFLNMVGYTREDLAAGRMCWTEMTPPQYRKLDEKASGQLAASGVCETFEKEYIRKDGSRISVLISVATFEGEKHNGVAFVLDITERKRAEESLRQSESQFRALFENALDTVLITNDLGVYLDANPAACDLLGISYNEVIGRTFYDSTEEDYRSEASRMWEQFRKEGRMRGDFRLRRPDGKVVEVDFTATANFVPGRHLLVLRDVTERRKLEEQLRQSQKLESVGMLAGGIAHDFNNLLTVITGYSELTLGRLKEADPLAGNVEEIKKAAARATSLTRQLLAFSRKQVLQPKVLDLNSVIADIEKMLGRLVGEDMELHTSPGAGIGLVKADPGQIEQVILNLVVNARDAMPKGGKITLETVNIYLDEEYARRHIGVQPGWYAMLAVTDTGHGMDAETQKYIFEPFFTTKEQGKGTGLGLSTVYGIVKQSGGNIWVYSEVGVGTTFKIYLPLVDEQVTEPDEGAARPESAAGTETILLAEDEEMVRNLARDSLKMHGYTVLDAANAGEALLICQQHEGPIHLLLADVVMPRMSGKELAEQLVRLRPDTRVLYMSGYTDQAIVHHGILDEDIAFIGKPFTPDALVLKVAEVLHQNGSSSQSLARINSPTPDESKEEGISYELNELDEIVSVSKGWTRFALANDAPDLVPEKVLNRPLWDFITDLTTEQLYRQILKRVRSGQAARFSFRCDASDRQRFMEMNVTALENGGVRFETRTLQSVDRPPQRLLDRYAPRADDLLRICGWCKSVEVGGAWKEVEEAVDSLRLFERPRLPELTHGICYACYAGLSAKLANEGRRLTSG